MKETTVTESNAAERVGEGKRAGAGSNVRNLTVVAMLSAISFILMSLDFPIPMLIPGFIKMDFSELPALLGSFALGPAAGVSICLIKNLLHLFQTSTAGTGELCNFLLGTLFVLPAGLIYHHKKTRKGAIAGALAGTVVMAVLSVFVNAYIAYPAYVKFYGMPMEAIIGAYQSINPKVNGLWACLIMFNVPFNLVKCLCSVIITMLIYKPLSPVLKGSR
ncbi:MAG: ECF transporter S component [Lachnospiraceae bacterium]|nr:ECF transporter S component [Lachnospiraceae bacterium]